MKKLCILLFLFLPLACEHSSVTVSNQTWFIEQLNGRSNRGSATKEKSEIIIPKIKEASNGDTIVFLTDYDTTIPKPLKFKTKRERNEAVDAVEAKNTGKPRNWEKDKPATSLPRLIFLACNKSVDEIIIFAGKKSNFTSNEDFFDTDWDMRSNGLSGARVFYLQNFVGDPPAKVEMIKDFLSWKLSAQGASVFFSLTQEKPHKVPKDFEEILRDFCSLGCKVEKTTQLSESPANVNAIKWSDEITITLSFPGGGFYNYGHALVDLDLAICRNSDCLSVRNRAPMIGKHFQERRTGKEIIITVPTPDDVIEISHESGPSPYELVLTIEDTDGTVLVRKEFGGDMYSGRATYPTITERRSYAWWSKKVRSISVKDLLTQSIQ